MSNADSNENVCVRRLKSGDAVAKLTACDFRIGAGNRKMEQEIDHCQAQTQTLNTHFSFPYVASLQRNIRKLIHTSWVRVRVCVCRQHIRHVDLSNLLFLFLLFLFLQPGKDRTFHYWRHRVRSVQRLLLFLYIVVIISRVAEWLR